MNDARPYWWNVNISSDYNLVPSGSRSLPEPMLKKVPDPIWCQMPQWVNSVQYNKVMHVVQVQQTWRKTINKALNFRNTLPGMLCDVYCKYFVDNVMCCEKSSVYNGQWYVNTWQHAMDIQIQIQIQIHKCLLSLQQQNTALFKKSLINIH